ncbi:MAG: hypothetical protein WBA57_09085 [Elainellaceae cyanobacterium]
MAGKSSYWGNREFTQVSYTHFAAQKDSQASVAAIAQQSEKYLGHKMQQK